MKFHVGDIVKIKDYKEYEIPTNLWISDMYEIIGKEAEVIEVIDDDVDYPELCVRFDNNGYKHDWYIYQDDVEGIVISYQTFTKDDLETGMIVECNNGDKYLVMKEAGRYIETDGYVTADSYNEDLTDVDGNERWDIKKVFRPQTDGINNMFLQCNDSTLVWDRSVREMTLDEIEKELGYKIKIVG